MADPKDEKPVASKELGGKGDKKAAKGKAKAKGGDGKKKKGKGKGKKKK